MYNYLQWQIAIDYFISVYPIKCTFLQSFIYILFFFVERPRATSRGLSGHFLPAGHRLGTPALGPKRSLTLDWILYTYMYILLARVCTSPPYRAGQNVKKIL